MTHTRSIQPISTKSEAENQSIGTFPFLWQKWSLKVETLCILCICPLAQKQNRCKNQSTQALKSYDLSDIYVPKSWVDMSFNSMDHWLLLQTSEQSKKFRVKLSSMYLLIFDQKMVCLKNSRITLDLKLKST